MVCLAHQQVAALDRLEHRRGELAQVSGHRRLASLPGEGVAHAARCVVGGGKGTHPQLAHRKPVPRVKLPAQPIQKGDAVTKLPQGGGSGVYRQLQLLGEGGQTGDVVAVLVGDQHAAEGGGVHPQILESGGDPSGGDARVHQQAGGAAAHQRAVSAGTAGQRRICQHRKIPPFITDRR